MKDTLQVCVTNFGRNEVQHLPLMEFSYDNSYHASIDIESYKGLYRKKCQSLIYEDIVGERKMVKVELTQETSKKKQVH